MKMDETLPRSAVSVAGLLVTAAFVWAFLPAWTALVQAWQSSEDYAHGFLIVPLALYVLWRDRSGFAGTPKGTSWLGLAVFFVAIAGYVFGLFAGIATLAYLGMILAAAGGGAFLFGGPVLRRCAFPLFLLLFMIPLPAQLHASLTAPLQLLVSKSAAFAIDLFGIPAYREGNIIHLPERSFKVIQACSGLRSIMSLLLLSLLMAFFTLRGAVPRTLLFLAGIPVAVLVNFARVLLMILALHYFGVDLTGDRLHTLFGLGIFALALGLLLFLQRCLSRWDTASTAKPSS